VPIRGREAPVLARALLVSLIDPTQLPEATDGDGTILVGESGALRRDLFAFAVALQSSATQLHFGLVGNLPKCG
jgi:hypothetical protein